MPADRVSLEVYAAAAIISLSTGLKSTAAQEQSSPGVANYSIVGPRAAMCKMDEHLDGQLAYLKTELKITDIQTPQWNIFAQAFRAEMEKKAQLCRQAMEQSRAGTSPNLLDSLKTMEDQLAKRLDSLRAMRAAVQPLYSILTPEQKKMADEIMKTAPIS
jgi:Spy/CpxP family protein refolding chaperone